MGTKRNLAEFEQRATVLWRIHLKATGQTVDKPNPFKPRTFGGFAYELIGDKVLEEIDFKPGTRRSILGFELDLVGDQPSVRLNRPGKNRFQNELMITEDDLPSSKTTPIDYGKYDLLAIGVSPPLTEEGTAAAGAQHFEAGDNRTAYLAMALAEAYADGVSVDLIPGHFS